MSQLNELNLFAHKDQLADRNSFSSCTIMMNPNYFFLVDFENEKKMAIIRGNNRRDGIFEWCFSSLLVVFVLSVNSRYCADAVNYALNTRATYEKRSVSCI